MPDMPSTNSDSTDRPSATTAADAAKSGEISVGRSWPGKNRLIAGGIILLISAAVFADWWHTVPTSISPSFVGRSRCIECHQTQAEKFAGSHHDLAMDLATSETVIGDFGDTEFTHHDVVSRLYRDGDKYMIHTEGPTGEMEDFHIKYVFGVDPIQQYMVEFEQASPPKEGEIGRVQVLRISWDVHGKKWFYLPPPDVAEKLAANDDLHWTGIAQRWNNMCAECHSTNLQKNFDVQTASYHTTFSEIDVSCEACHGPGSTHIDLATSNSLFWDRKQGYGLAKLKGKDPEMQIQSCAQCHSRRRKVHPDFRPGAPFFDHYATELASPLTYFSDGQIMDEVYVHGSFLQSKMYHKGIRCTDCHDPHSVKVKFDGNKLCTSCHEHPAGKYDGPSHHHHAPNSTGAKCVECHMPETTYMELDPRRDHSLRVPRPDLSVDLGVPNACSRCHFDEEKMPAEQQVGMRQYLDYVRAAADDPIIQAEIGRLDRWSLDAVKKWYPNSKQPATDHWSTYLQAAWDGEDDPSEALLKVVKKKSFPAFIRATALSQLTRFGDVNKHLKEVEPFLEDPHPLVRMAAASVFERLMPQIDIQLTVRPETVQSIADDLRPKIYPLLKLLDDPSRLVRAEAARVLSGIDHRVAGTVLYGDENEKVLGALEELRVGVMENNDRAGAHAMMGNIYANLGRYDKAEEAYENALIVEPFSTGPRTNLAELMDYHMNKLDAQARQYAQQGNREPIEELAGQIATYQIRAEDYRREELPNVARDARLAPNSAPIVYRYATCLYVNGFLDQAVVQLDRTLELEPNNPDFLLMQAMLMEKMENFPRAMNLVEQLIKEVPNHPPYLELRKRILRGRQTTRDKVEKDGPAAK
jgi:tetratricopeptide (TPR) repeat protein